MLIFCSEQREHKVYRDLICMVPGLEDRLMQDGELEVAADYVRSFLYLFMICTNLFA